MGSTEDKSKKIVMDGTEIGVDAAVERYKAVRASAKLNDRHAAIFETKFGVTDGVIRTYAETGRKFNISHTRARQLCALVIHQIGLSADRDLSDK